MKGKIIAGIAMAMIIIMTVGCGQKQKSELVIAEQYGLAYAPIVVMREKGFLQEALGDETTIRWEKLGNTAAIREAMLTDNLDVGFIGIPPFLIGADQGMDWRIISGLSSSPLGLITNDENINNLEDLRDKGKIALPQPGSIQHILLAMAAQEALGDATALDHQLIAMKHPEGYQALKASGDVTAHFTSPPYIFQEMDDDELNLLLTGDEAFGDSFTFIVGVCQESFIEDEASYAAFNKALERSIEFIQESPVETVDLLGEVFQLEGSVVRDYIYGRGMNYSTEVKGLGRFIEFMEDVGYIQSDLTEEGLVW